MPWTSLPFYVIINDAYFLAIINDMNNSSTPTLIDAKQCIGFINPLHCEYFT